MATRRNTHFKKILAADCETTGVCIRNDDPIYRESNGERHQALSWGFIVADADTLEPIEELYLEVKWNEESKRQRDKDPKFGSFAEGIHGLTFDHLEKHGMEEEEAVTEIANLIVKHFALSPISILGHNVEFDRSHLRSLMRRYSIDVPFAQRNVDTFSLGMVCWDAFDSNELFDIVSGETREAHNAMEDIRLTLEAARTTKNLFKQLLDG